MQRARPEVINIRHWELLLCKALHKHLPKPVLALNTLDVNWGKADEVGGQEVQGKQDNAGYHNELPAFAKNSFHIKGGEKENAEGR